MVDFTYIEQFVKSYKAYSKVAKTTQAELLERFITFQHSSKLEQKDIVSAFNYMIELIYVETKEQFTDISERDVTAYYRNTSKLTSAYNRMIRSVQHTYNKMYDLLITTHKR